MMSFADRVNRDNQTILDPRRFGELRDIDGATVCCVLSRDIYQQAAGQITDGEYAQPWILTCLADAFLDRPIPNQELRIDGRLYLVQSCQEAMGMLTIHLTVHAV